MAKILVILDNSDIASLTREYSAELHRRTEIFCADGMERAQGILRDNPIDICIIDYEAHQLSIPLYAELLQSLSPATDLFILALAQNYSYTEALISSVNTVVLLKPLKKDDFLYSVQRTLDASYISQFNEYNPSVHDLWNRTRPMLADMFWTELLLERIGRRIAFNQKDYLQLALAAGIGHIENRLVLPILFFSRRTPAEQSPDFLRVQTVFKAMAQSIVIGEDSGYTVFPQENFQAIILYPYNNLAVREIARRCFYFCREMERQFDQNNACVIGCPCAMEDLPSQWLTLRQFSIRNQFRSEIVYTLENAPLPTSEPIQNSNSPRWAHLIIDGQTDIAIQEIRSYFNFSSSAADMTSDHVLSVLYDINHYVTNFMEPLGINLDAADESLQIRQQFIYASRSQEDLINWITMLSNFCARRVKANLRAESIIDATKDYIRRNLAGDLSREKIAKQMNISANHLERLFKGATGSTLTEFILTKRLELAKYYLTHTRHNITEISLKSGFSSHAYFSTCFKKHVHITPNQYRKANALSRDAS